jgi:hypothetical protein
MENNDIIEDISTLSECENDAKYIKDIKMQSFLLGSLGIILFCFALEIHFNQGQLLELLTHNSALKHPSILFVFLLASFGNLIASYLLYREANTEEKQLKKLQAAFLANSSLR